MFVAWRDLRFAKGRFALMGAVILLITLLVGLLSGLTAGLGRENVSAITSLPADHLAFAAPGGGQDVSFTNSRIEQHVWQQWGEVPGVRSAEPLGIAMTRAQVGSASFSLSAFGVRPGSPIAPHADALTGGTVVLSGPAAAELAVLPGDSIRVGGDVMTVAAVGGDAMYSHTPVAWVSLSDWQRLGATAGDGMGATVVALSTVSGSGLPAADETLSTTTVSVGDALQAIGSYTAENGSLQLMRGFLFAISALVIGAFFTVWTIQRSGDVAVLKALGAATGYLLRDALAQAVLVLVIGTGIGTALAAGIGVAIGDSVPFVLDATTVLLPMTVLIILGALGAAISIRRITSVDPLTALGSAR
ncbi:ABC transporter permease [Amycolatopsis palatopharyngis]|uniref:ABC transporter permease n=1 Tax=Amycolatopsis palatopharyngis TaxID=187982 RepID=UPI000E2265F1|nr:ABC transporter permease [Amycolatopsis palatopharyngis]